MSLGFIGFVTILHIIGKVIAETVWQIQCCGVSAMPVCAMPVCAMPMCCLCLLILYVVLSADQGQLNRRWAH